MRILLGLALAGPLLVAACADGGQGPLVPEAVEAVVVQPDSVELVVGGNQALAVKVLGQDGRVLEGRAVEWTRNPEGVVSMDGAGVVTALSEGAASLTATSGGGGRTTVVVRPGLRVRDPPGRRGALDRRPGLEQPHHAIPRSGGPAGLLTEW